MKSKIITRSKKYSTNSMVIKAVFNLVAYGLESLANRTGFTYNEINIIVYYILIPLSWAALLDLVLQIHYSKIAFAIFLLGFFTGCRSFRTYSDWLFFKSVDFLNYFNRFGSNYKASSVYICVLIPLFVYGILIYFWVR